MVRGPRPFRDAAPVTGPVERDPRKLIRSYVRGKPVHVIDHTLSDAFFLASHPSWSQRDLMEADQDLIDYLSAIQHEGAVHSKEQSDNAQREAWAASNRARQN